jgi:hypothetical protein
MPPPEHGPRLTLRLWLTTSVLLVLLALIAIGSRDGAFGVGSQARPTPGYIDWAMSVFLVLFVLMIPFAIYAYSIQMREWRAKKERQSFQSRVLRGFGAIAILMVFGLVVALIRRNGLHFPTLNSITGASGKGGAAGQKRWPVLWLTLLLLALGGAIWWRHRPNRTGTPWAAAEDEIADDVVASIGEALDDLEAEQDARRAVIAAYARMERVLARHGLRRKESETAVEYLRRILLGLTSRTDAVTRLTSLFEQAKFSRHEIDGSMKQDAIDALRAIRDDLQGVPA